AADRSVEEVEALVGDDRGDVRGGAAAQMAFVGDHDSIGFLDRSQDRVFVERDQRARIDYFNRDFFLIEFFRDAQRLRHHRADRDHRDVVAGALHGGLAKRYQVLAGGDILAGPAERAVLED